MECWGERDLVQDHELSVLSRGLLSKAFHDHLIDCSSQPASSSAPIPLSCRTPPHST